MNSKIDLLRAKSYIREQPFTSQMPLIGPLLARFRAAWNGIATRWYVLPLVQQQNEFNELLLDQLQEMQQMLQDQANAASAQAVYLEDTDERLIAQDHEVTQLRHDLAEASAYLVQTRRMLEKIEQRLAALADASGDEAKA